MNPISEDEFADYKDNYFGFDAGNGINNLIDDFPDFLSDEEIMEILAIEAELGIDLTDLEDEEYDDFDDDEAHVDSDIY